MNFFNTLKFIDAHTCVLGWNVLSIFYKHPETKRTRSKYVERFFYTLPGVRHRTFLQLFEI